MGIAEDYAKFKEEHQQGRVYDVKSVLSIGDAMLFQEEQTASDKALNVGKAFYNGAVAQTAGGVLHGLQWLRDVNEAQLNADHPERQQMDEGMRQLLDDAANAEALKPYEVQANSAAERFAYDLIQGGGQLVGQVAIGALTGGYGNLPAMALQIGGEEYKELREHGVDVETAGKAAAWNAAIQTPLEYIGFSKLTKSIPANTLLKQRLRKVAEDAFTEGITEYLQEYPEQISKLWAQNADKSPEEIKQIVLNELSNINASALYSGTIGALLGTSAGSLHLALDRDVKNAMIREAHTIRMEEEEKRIANIKESGENPARAAVIINDNMQNETVHIDGEALQGYAQSHDIKQIADSLGVTVEEIETAAAEGDTVDVKLGNFEATSAAFDGFFQTVKDDTAFEDGGYTPNKEKQEAEEAKAAREMQNALRTEQERLVDQITTAGRTKAEAAGIVDLLTMRALVANPDNPAEFLKNAPKYIFGGEGVAAEGFHQFAGENARGANTDALQKAIGMVWIGKTPEEIYKETGWFKGEDNKWRFEIPDDVNKINYENVKKRGKSTLEKVYDNPALFEAYPFLKKIRVVAAEYDNDDYHGQTYGRTIEISKKDLEEDENEALYTLVHEIQHLIQDREGFARGGTAEAAREILGDRLKKDKKLSKLTDDELYENLAGEQEARYTEDRADLRLQIYQALEDKADAEEKLAEAIKNKDENAEDEARKAVFVATMQERKARQQLETLPTPHDENAIVIFGDSAVAKITAQTPSQALDGYAQIDKGFYDLEHNTIKLFKGADASTVIHETWHFFVEEMWNSVKNGTASEQTVKDFNKLLDYAGMTMEQWENADTEGRRAAHEKLAEAGETYIMEGKAPSYDLRRVFKNFARWLKAVYRTIQRSENAAELTDEVREVFDRMLAAEDDIAHMEKINGYFAKLPDVITDNMSDETRAKVEDFIEKARDRAVEMLTRRALKNYTKERREEIRKFKEEIRPSVEEEVSKRRVYACGYTKADAAKYEELQKLKREFGIWTDENFIDRSFPAESDPYANEVAHMAAAYEPKNWKAGLEIARADYAAQRDKMLADAQKTLESGMGNGVDIIQDPNTGRYLRVSKNAQWYRDFYKEHGRKPNKTEIAEMVRQLVTNDPNAPKVKGWTATNEESAKALEESAKHFAELEKLIETADAIKGKLAESQKEYKNLTSEKTEAFMLKAELDAEQYGYSSADEMMKDVAKSPTQAQAVNQRINELAQEKSKELTGNYETAIHESLYNEDEALLIGVEQQLIEDYARKAKGQQIEQAQVRSVQADIAAAKRQQAKNAAKADLAQMNVKDATRTSKFITAERKAAIKSAQLLLKKDYAGALAQKNLQAYWHAMAAESMKIARRQKQYEKFLKKQVGLKREAWLNETHFAAISQLFVRMGIARKVHAEAAANAEIQSLAAYAKLMRQQFDCVDIAEWLMDENIPINDTNALTLEQYEDVVNAVKNIKAIVKAQKGVNMFSTQEAWAGTKAHIMGMLAPLKTLWEPNPNKVSKPSKKEQWLAGLETMDTVCEMLDGGRYGWFSQHWNNLMKRCQDREYDHRKAYDDAETEAYKKWIPDKAAEAAANEEVYYEELGTSVTKHTLVRMLMNLGNKENSQRICETVPVGFEKSTLWIMPDESLAANQKELRAMREEAREMTRKNLIDFLGKVLTEEDVQYAQRRINAMEMFWGERVELDKRTKGFAPKKVEATPVLLDVGEKQVVLQGGYCPLLRYGETGSHSAAQEVNEDEPLQGKNIRTYHTNTSSSKARTNARYPVDLRLGTERNWIYESIHDLCWREDMGDFRRVLNDQEVYAMLKSKMGLSRMNLFKELLEVSADGRNSKPLSEFEKSISDTAGWLTSRTTNALVMCSLKISSQNLADCFLYGNAVEGYTMADNISALGRYMLCFNLGKWKEMRDFVFSKSAYMEERSLIPDVTIRDMMADEKEKKWQKVLRETTTKMFALTDNATAIPNWMQAYNKKINEGWAEQDAIDFADAVVRRVKGSSRNTEISSMQRSKVLKPITMFQSFFNARFNEFLRMERYATNQWTDGQKAEAFSTVASYVMAKVLAQAMLALAFAAENPFGIDDEDKWPNLIKELKSQTFSMFGPIGQAASAAVGAAAGMREFDYRMSAIESTVNKGIGAIRAVRSDKKTAAEKVEAATNFATLVSGAPMQITKIFWNAFDIVFNNMSPEIGDIMRRRPKIERDGKK